MDKGFRFTGTCIGVNNYAKGIVKIDSLICFVDDLYEGETALIEITDIKKNLCFGKVIKLINKAPYRIDRVCNHKEFSSCPFNNITYEAELNIKKKMIINNFNRSLSLNINDIPIVGEEINGYRNKVTIFYKEQNGDIVIGNFIEDSNEIVNIDSCVQIKDIFLSIAKHLAQLLKKYNISVCDFRNKKGNVKGISIRRSEYNNQISILILTRFDDNRFIDISKELCNEYKDIVGIALSINEECNTFIYSGKQKQLFGVPYITEKFNDILLKASNSSFLQVNTKIASLLYKEACNSIPLTKDDIVVDLYSGCGGIGLTLANKVKEVYSIETVNDAVILAKENALNNNINNISFYRADALEFDTIIKDKNIKVLYVDPPRAGLDNRVIDKILSLDIENIIYISCDSFTQARDIKLLSSKYKIKSIKAFDLFPRTKHVETIVALYLQFGT